MPSRLSELHNFGQSPWYDNIERDLLLSGELSKMIDEDGITGVTSNPSIFERAILTSSSYDDEIIELIKQKKSLVEIYDQLTAEDIITASDILTPVYDKTNGLDGYVSLEISPRLSRNTAETIAEARRLFQRIGKKNVMIKIPATEEGLIAVTALIAEGVNVDVTLIFSKEHYRKASQAYIDGIRKRLGRGLPVDQIASVASFFVSRIDTHIDKMLDDIIKKESNPGRIKELGTLKGKAAVAQSKVIYNIYRGIFESHDFAELKKRGARPQRLLFGSTSTKDPGYSDVKYVEELIGEGTINTIPQKTIECFRDHGKAAPTLADKVNEAEAFLYELDRHGIDVELICQKIQDEGIARFLESFEILLASLGKKKKSVS